MFFKRASPHSTIWVCLCGTERRNNKTGYSNLASHAYEKPTDDVLTLTVDAVVQPLQIVSSFFIVPKKIILLYAWSDMVAMGLQPFRFVEDEVMTNRTKYHSVIVDTFMTMKFVEQKVARLLPDKVALVFDGWISGSTHYLEIFSSFPTKNVFVLTGFDDLIFPSGGRD